LEEREEIVDAFERQDVSAEDFVVREGDEGDTFYIVESGTLDVYLSRSGSADLPKV
jgi:CRP-like cAMP-binding protein